jgi:Tfp pilus assembly protein PilZ
MVKVISSDGTLHQFLTHTENIGLGGLCVTLKNEIKLFTPVDIEIDLLDIGEHIIAQGKVVWRVRRKSIEKVKPMFHDTGIEFTEISKRDQDRLRDTLQLLIDKGTPLSKPYL